MLLKVRWWWINYDNLSSWWWINYVNDLFKADDDGDDSEIEIIKEKAPEATTSEQPSGGNLDDSVQLVGGDANDAGEKVG